MEAKTSLPISIYQKRNGQTRNRAQKSKYLNYRFFHIITWTKRLFLTCTILVLLATNILTLTGTAFNAALSGFMSTTPGCGYGYGSPSIQDRQTSDCCKIPKSSRGKIRHQTGHQDKASGRCQLRCNTRRSYSFPGCWGIGGRYCIRTL